ncbi:hypothetical protein ACFHW2_12045 [Actinomadura sp. LOL_016]|uniref:hypothetical protein n=1 Tax=unclassified Actinomadura TaxID=2626254 RepID=UPI003A806F39
MSDHEEPQFDMVMPFVTVESKGGPHDDASYVAGYEMGRLDAVLEAGPPRHETTIHTVSAKQADLLAMRHGYHASIVDSETAGWSYAVFTRQETS